MKDAKGHGSDPRGAHSEGVNAIGRLSTEDFFAKSAADWDAAYEQAKQILSGSNPKAVFESGDRKMIVSKSLDPRYDFRVTNFDAKGPVGHREYNTGDIKDLAYEINDARIGGLKLRTKE